MTLEMELKRQWRQGEAKGRAKGRAEGRAEEKTTAALKMLRDHVPLDVISKYTELSVDAITRLAKGNKLV